MPKFEYVGMSEGKQVRDIIEAASKDEATLILRRKRIRVTSIRGRGLGMDIPLPSIFTPRIKLKDISRLTRQFAAMVNAGLPLVQCLDILGAQTENPELAKSVKQVSSDIQGGNNLADAMMRFPKAFSPLYCNMVAAGEQSGRLAEVLNRLAEYLEKSEGLRRKIKGAMTYPVIVLVVSVVAVAAMLGFVVPTFAQMFIDMGGDLPLPTKIVMDISEFLKNNVLLILGVGVLGVIAFSYYYKTDAGRIVVDGLKLKLPILGDLERKSSVSRFSQTLSTLLSSGVPILEALNITAKTAGNKVLELAIMRTLERITGGMSIAEPLSGTGVFPPMVIHMIAVGEKTGDLSGMLKKVSDFYREEVDAAVDALTSVIEPIMICVLGALVGGILIAMYLPMFDMVGMM